MEDPELRQITIFTGRGLFSESLGPVWMIGTGEWCILLHTLRLTDQS